MVSGSQITQHSLEKPQTKRELIEAEIAEKRSHLAKMCIELKEVQLGVNQLKAYICMLENLLVTIELSEEAETPAPASFPNDQSVQRSPMEMIRPEYKGMKLGDIAVMVIAKEKTPLTTTELTHLIYAPRTTDEFERARNSLASELRSGAKGNSPRWKKIGRHAYTTIK
jgi:hypothetical protein